jgi:hypothetical protein
MDEHEILEQTRKASIEAAANVLEFVARAKAQHQARARRRPRDKSGAAAPQGDLLMELIQLNARFLNRVVELVGEHRSTAHRALEHFYTQLVPSSFGRSVEPLLFTQVRQTRTIKFENRSLNRANVYLRITWNDLQGPRPSRPVGAAFVFTPGEAQKDGAWLVEAPYGTPLELKVELRSIDDKLRERCSYTTELELTLDKQTQRIPVTVERPAI